MGRCLYAPGQRCAESTTVYNVNETFQATHSNQYYWQSGTPSWFLVGFHELKLAKTTLVSVHNLRQWTCGKKNNFSETLIFFKTCDATQIFSNSDVYFSRRSRELSAWNGKMFYPKNDLNITEQYVWIYTHNTNKSLVVLTAFIVHPKSLSIIIFTFSFSEYFYSIVGT